MGRGQEKITTEKARLMRIIWSEDAVSDLKRLVAFLEDEHPQAAFSVLDSAEIATRRLAEHARIGEMLDEFLPREVRRLVLDHYELRYEIDIMYIRILRMFHEREDR